PDPRSHRSYRRRFPLEPDGWRVREGRPVPAPGDRRGAARPYRGGAGRRRSGEGVIAQLVDLARRRADGGADALWRRFERTTVAFEWGRLKSAGTTEEAGANLRVRHCGRVGVAGTTAVGGDVGAQHAAPLLDRALASAELGEALDLEFPGPPSPPATLPTVTTYFDRAANASHVDLIGIGRSLLPRLEREEFGDNVRIGRELAASGVVNSAGRAGEFRRPG